MDTPKVLIIDDSVTSRLYMTEALRKGGYKVMSIANGTEGLHQILREPPDCLILDVLLPGVGGFEVCRRVRAQAALRKLPIIMISTKNTRADQTWGLRQGANRYLPKPFTEETLLHTVEEVLLERPRPPESADAPRATFQDTPRRGTHSPLHKLIPRRVNTASPLNIADRRLHFLYTNIDGYKSLEQLCMITQMSQESLIRALFILLSQRRIRLYEPDGREVDSSHLFSI
jgi:chemotaxis family two-component system response regulator PixH